MTDFANLQADALSAAGFVNENGLIPTRYGGNKKSWQYLVDQFEAEFAETLLEINKSRGYRVVGTFSAGFDYELFNDVGIDANGNSWIYVGAGAPVKTVTAGTVPSGPDYHQVTFNDHNVTVNRSAANAHDDIYTRNFKSTADLRAQTDAGGNHLDFTDFPQDTKFYWQGYYAPSDGGSNWGRLKFGDSTSLVDDGGSIFVIVNDAVNGVWVEANIKGKKLNVMKFGAVGGVDASVADSSAQIQNAWNTGRALFFPEPHYRIDNALDFTNALAGGHALEGETRGISRNGTVIHMNTGGVGIDFTGTQAVKTSNITFDSTDPLLTNPSTVGILSARSITSQYAQFNVFDNVSVLMHNDPASNSGQGTIGIYNIASEITTYRDIYVSANSPLVITSTNIKNIASPYQTIGGPTSTSNITFDGTCTLNARGNDGYSLEMRSVAVAQGFMYLSRSEKTASDTYAMKLGGSMDAVKIFCQVEFHDHVGLLDNGCDGLDIHATKAVGSKSPFKTVSGFTGISRCKLRVDNILATPATAPYILEVDGGDAFVDGELISKVWTPATAATNASMVSTSYDVSTDDKRTRTGSIQFSNNSGDTSSTAINYFKKGTISPTVFGETSAGTATYTVQGGWYQRVGDVVSFSVTLSWSAHTGTGNLAVSGLPFPSDGSPLNRACFSIYTSGLSGVTGNLAAIVGEGTQNILISQINNGVQSRVAIPANGNLTITGSHKV